MQQFKRVKFGLQKTKQEATFQKLAKNNTLIQTFVVQNVDIEPIRKRRRGASTDLKRVREQAKSLYVGIRSRWSCKGCSHLVNIPVDPIWPVDAQHHLETQGADQESTPALEFKVIFSMAPANASAKWAYQETRVEIIPHEGQDHGPTPDGQGLAVEASEAAGAKALPARKRDKLISWISGSRSKTPSPDPSKQKKSIKFADETSPQAGPSGAILTALRSTPTLKDMCAALSNIKPSEQHSVCLGHWKCEQNMTFLVYPVRAVGAASPSQKLVSLAQALSTTEGSAAALRLSRGDRLQLAHIVASCVLRFSKTPWLADKWTKEDILIAQQESQDLKERVFLSKAFPDSPQAQLSGEQTEFPGLRNQTLFMLGIVLIELCLGKPLAALRAPTDPLDGDGKPNVLTDWCTSTRLLPDVAQEAGNRYCDAVRRCIYCDFDQRVTSLDNESFKQAVYNGVVAPLEDILQDFQNG